MQMKVTALLLATFLSNSAAVRPQQQRPVQSTPFSVSASGDGSFAGAVSSHQGVSLFDSITAKRNVDVGGDVTASKIVASSAQIDEAKFTKSVRVDGPLNVTSGLGVKGSIHTTSLIAGLIEAQKVEVVDLVRAKRLNVAHDIVVEGKLSSAGGFYTKDGSVIAKEVESDTAKVKGKLEANDVEVRGDLSAQKHLIAKEASAERLTVYTKLEIPSKASASFDGDVTVNGKAIFSNRVQIQQLEIVKFDAISSRSPTIDASKGNIVAGQLTVGTNMTSNQIVTNELQAKTISASGNAEFGSVETNTAVAKALETDKLLVNATTAKVLTVLDRMTAANATLSDTLTSKSIKAESASVTNLESTQLKTRSMTVDGDMNVVGTINGTSITIGDLSIGVQSKVTSSSITRGKAPLQMMQTVSRFGCMELTMPGTGIVMDCSLSVNENATIGEKLTAKAIDAQNLSSNLISSESLTASEIKSGRINVTEGMVVSSDGFESTGDMQIGNVVATGMISAPAVQGDEMKAETALISALTIEKNAHIQDASFKGDVTFAGKTLYHGGVNFTSDVATNKLNAQTIQVADGVEVGGGVFAKRVYAQDISITGFVTAPSIISKGNVDVSGSVNTVEVSAEKISSQQILSNDLQCSTANVKGTLDAGSLSAQKVSVAKELIVFDTNILETMKDLHQKIAALEEQIKQVRGGDK